MGVEDYYNAILALLDNSVILTLTQMINYHSIFQKAKHFVHFDTVNHFRDIFDNILKLFRIKLEYCSDTLRSPINSLLMVVQY